MPRDTTVDVEMEPMLNTSSSQSPQPPRSPPPLSSAATTTGTIKTRIKVYVTNGYVRFMIVTIILAVYLFIFQLCHIPKITGIRNNSTDPMPLLFMTLSVLTSIPTALVFGKPYTGAYIGLGIFIVMLIIAVVARRLWDWFERTILTLIPCIFGSQYLTDKKRVVVNKLLIKPNNDLQDFELLQTMNVSID